MAIAMFGLYPLSTDDHILVYWPGEDCTTVLFVKNIIHPCPPVLGASCTVRIGTNSQFFQGVAINIDETLRN